MIVHLSIMSQVEKL